MKKTEKLRQLTGNKEGFTLIELLIVIAIIGVLAVAFLPSLLGAPAKARDAQRQAQIQKVQSFMVGEALMNPGDLPVTGCIRKADIGGGISALIDANLSGFGGVFPEDPSGEQGGNAIGCPGGYGYIKYDVGSGNEYDFALVAEVESDTTANVKCAGQPDHFAEGASTADINAALSNGPGGEVEEEEVVFGFGNVAFAADAPAPDPNALCYAVFVST
jgi:prepilin-type N-terminal cleavage/methylation domain-containing protein